MTDVPPQTASQTASLPALSRRAPSRTLGLELTEDGARAIELIRSGQRYAAGCRAEVSFAADATPAARGEQLAAALEAAGVTTSKVVISVPRHLVILRELTLPATDPEELRLMAQLKMERELPFPLEEMSGALGVIDTGSGSTGVMAGYVKREHLERQLQVARAAGLEVVGAGVSTLLALDALRSTAAFDGQPRALVAAGPKRTEIGITTDVGEGARMLSRTAFVGTAGLDPVIGADAPCNQRFFDELTRTFTSFHGGKDPIAAVALAGQAADPAVVALIKGHFDIPVAPFAPLDGPLFVDQPQADDARYATAVGAALMPILDRPLGGAVDFLPPPPTLRDKLKLDKRWLYAGAALCALLLIYVIPPLHFAGMESDIGALTTESAELKKLGKALEVHREKVEEMAPWVRQRRTRWLDAYLLVNQLVDNKRAYITSFKLNDLRAEKTVTIAGRAKSSQDCTTLAARFSEHSALEAELKGTSTSRSKDGFGVSFTIELTLDPAELPVPGAPGAGEKSAKGGKGAANDAQARAGQKGGS